MTTPKRIIGGVVAIALVGGGFWLLKTGRTEISYGRVTPEQAERAVAVLSTDTDKDGLKDWEEELWHTDPKKSDTDGDGTPDAEEIKLGRDPVKKGPDDKLDKETIEKKTVPGGGDWTETDKLSREFFAKYLSMRKADKPFTEEDGRALLSEFRDRAPKAPPQKMYTESDIVSAKDDTDTSLRAYGNAVGDAINALPPNVEGELVIFERALQDSDPSELKSLDGRIKRYEDLLASLKAISVPGSAQKIHLAFLNSIEGLKESVGGMAISLSDPVHSMPIIMKYQPAFTAMMTALTEITTLFEKKGITFGNKEGGVILTK